MVHEPEQSRGASISKRSQSADMHKVEHGAVAIREYLLYFELKGVVGVGNGGGHGATSPS